jgi:AcrR family transcriptional regulator
MTSNHLLMDSTSASPLSSRRNLLDTGLLLFEEQGFSTISLADIAAAAGQPLAELYRHFGSKNDFVLGLYQRIHDELEARAAEYSRFRS